MTAKTGPIKGSSSADVEDIKQTVMNYIEAWYQGDPERGIKSLHPDLAKRIVRTHSESSRDTLENMSAALLAERWRSGQGRETPPEKRMKEVTVLDIYGGMASVRLETGAWVDYMHLAKFDDQWVIVNVLWEIKK